MTEQESRQARKSLQETIQWCSRHDLLSSAPETPEFRRRWNLLEMAGKLLRGAKFQSVQWNEGMKMLAEADPDNLVPLKSQLRSPELTPSADIGRYSVKTSEKSIVDEVVSKRASLLASDSFDATASRQAPGRLLIYEPTENVSDGASQVSSHGFFDLYDAPPWDTWVHYANNRELICWVPEALIALAQKGIDANPVDCIHWAAPHLLQQPQLSVPANPPLGLGMLSPYLPTTTLPFIHSDQVVLRCVVRENYYTRPRKRNPANVGKDQGKCHIVSGEAP